MSDQRRSLLIGIVVVASLLVLAAAFAPRWHGDSSVAAAGPVIADFTLEDQNGAPHSLYGYASARAVVIIGHGNSCPIIQKYATRINELNAEYSQQNVKFLMINPNSEDDRASVATEAKDYGFEVPILLDPKQTVTRALGLTRTAEVVVLDTKTWRVLYQGAIDDRLDYGVDKQQAQHNFLTDALSDILGGQSVREAFTPAKGCKYSFFVNATAGSGS